MAERGTRMPRGPRSSHVILALSLGVAVWCAAGVPLAASAADDDGGGGTGIVVDVTDDTPTPTPTPTPSIPGGIVTPSTPGTQGGSGSSYGTGGSGSQSGAGGQGAIPAEPTSSLPGKPVALAVGGISASVAPTFAVDGGSATLAVVVRNTSGETFDATARFVVTNLFGVTIGEEEGIPVGPLEPDAARTVTASFEDLGQNVLVRGFVTITPPETVGGIELSPVTRDTLVFVPPLFAIAVIAAAGAVGWASWWAIGRARRDAVVAAPLAKARV